MPKISLVQPLKFRPLQTLHFKLEKEQKQRKSLDKNLCFPYAVWKQYNTGQIISSLKAFIAFYIRNTWNWAKRACQSKVRYIPHGMTVLPKRRHCWQLFHSKSRGTMIKGSMYSMEPINFGRWVIEPINYWGWSIKFQIHKSVSIFSLVFSLSCNFMKILEPINWKF